MRVERLQQITERDAIAEGCPGDLAGFGPLDEFRALWNSLNARRGFGWDANPWVWVIEWEPFTR